MILEADAEEKEDYRIIMLKENDIPGVLKTDVRYVDNKSQYYYDVSSKTSFKMLHEKIHLTLGDMRGLVTDLLDVIHTLKKYMLDEKSILLEPEYIFCEDGKYYFCYYPPCEQNIGEDFHKLTEFFVREVNYKDEEGVRFAYTLHKATMEDNYSIEEIMSRLIPAQEEEEETPCEPEFLDYTQRMEQLAQQESIVEERDSMWESVRKFLEKSKKRKRGYSSEHL